MCQKSPVNDAFLRVYTVILLAANSLCKVGKVFDQESLELQPDGKILQPSVASLCVHNVLKNITIKRKITHRVKQDSFVPQSSSAASCVRPLNKSSSGAKKLKSILVLQYPKIIAVETQFNKAMTPLKLFR